MGKFLWIFAVILAGAGPLLGADSGPNHAMLAAYADMDYPLAEKLAAKTPDTPEGQLVRGLCDL